MQKIAREFIIARVSLNKILFFIIDIYCIEISEWFFSVDFFLLSRFSSFFCTKPENDHWTYVCERVFFRFQFDSLCVVVLHI